MSKKTILVTGASSGIGEAIVKLLALSNYSLVLTARNESKLQKVCSSLNGSVHKFFKSDFENNDLLDDLVSNLPKIDGIVFCAGYNEYIPIKFINTEKANKIFNINYLGSMYLLQKILSKKLLNKGSS